MKIGVYICHCGKNIADKVDVKKVVEFFNNYPDVFISRDYIFLCSDAGQNLIQEDIKNFKLDRIVIGSCSPTMHLKTFQGVLEKVKINPHFIEIANLREQCSWVTKDKNYGTEKAVSLLKGAIEKVKYHEKIERKKMPIAQKVAVIGGGIAGIQASLDIAEAGYEVFLIEKKATIGGHMAFFDKTFPTLDCASCILTPKMSEVRNKKIIKIFTLSEIKEIQGTAGNYILKIIKKPRYVDEEKCIGCGICIENCVYKEGKFPNEYDFGLSLRKPIYIPLPYALPLSPVIDKDACIYFKTGKCPRTCEKACKEEVKRGAINFEQKEEEIEINVGAIIVATGYKTFNPERVYEYGYKRYKNVFSSLEIERMLSCSGPTKGEILTRDGRKPKSVGIIHCVGSRDINYNRYCSKVCCMYALKFSYLIKERTNAEIYHFYIDIRASGKGYEEFYERVQKEGAIFIRGKPSEINEKNGKLIVKFENTLTGKVQEKEFDMVILCNAIEPSEGTKEIAEILKLSKSEDGFLLELHPKLEPVSTSISGIFIAGCAQGPKDIPETVAQASACASKVIAFLNKKEYEIENLIAYIDEKKCTGCGKCVNVCAFDALYIEDGKCKIKEINCKGCGICSATCFSNAINVKNMGYKEIIKQVEGILK
uniref:CoB--CoM heterodisulfide reductase iron-sulfur subunit A family protein n=1 Tax=candidate division WOR-3 bacterium TaxID=2052148 RepID=A0A7V3ZT34_UNCW3